MNTQRVELIVTGRVQGVGFRPFIARLANRFQVTGWALNEGGQVRIQAQGLIPNIEKFKKQIVLNAPPASSPFINDCESIPSVLSEGFVIRQSQGGVSEKWISDLPLDLFTCSDCLREMNDASNRRYQYPFINCTQCGPRYSLLEDIPYDRPMTSMAEFKMCERCQAEYDDPLDRRYHAEPNACPDCGPALTWHCGPQRLTGDEALASTVTALAAGKVLAIKGVGGYHCPRY